MAAPGGMPRVRLDAVEGLTRCLHFKLERSDDNYVAGFFGAVRDRRVHARMDQGSFRYLLPDGLAQPARDFTLTGPDLI